MVCYELVDFVVWYFGEHVGYLFIWLGVGG